MPPPEQRRPFPDKAHEDLARWVEETLASLHTTQGDVSDTLLLADTLFTLVDSNRGAGQQHGADLGDSLLLVDALFGLVDSLLTFIDAQRIRIDAVNIRCDTAINGLDALQARVTELEKPLP